MNVAPHKSTKNQLPTITMSTITIASSLPHVLISIRDNGIVFWQRENKQMFIFKKICGHRMLARLCAAILMTLAGGLLQSSCRTAEPPSITVVRSVFNVAPTPNKMHVRVVMLGVEIESPRRLSEIDTEQAKTLIYASRDIRISENLPLGEAFTERVVETNEVLKAVQQAFDIPEAKHMKVIRIVQMNLG